MAMQQLLYLRLGAGRRQARFLPQRPRYQMVPATGLPDVGTGFVGRLRRTSNTTRDRSSQRIGAPPSTGKRRAARPAGGHRRFRGARSACMAQPGSLENQHFHGQTGRIFARPARCRATCRPAARGLKGCGILQPTGSSFSFGGNARRRTNTLGPSIARRGICHG